ncbi:hypothetical protein ACFWTC_34930 [Streptomyces sp. NPDC058619]|uniref:hypothetical protein n=1 Tax=unclassified Streptomyces TaxID=2593676 RepID=UPI0036495CB6
MTDDDLGMKPGDAAAVDVFETALRAFAGELNRLHIAHGAPSYTVMAGASVRPRLTRASLNEMLTGKRLTSLETLLEFVRGVTIPPGLPPAAAASFRADPALAAARRTRWQEVKLLQRASQPAGKRLRATVRQSLNDAAQEAEALREDARTEAERIRTSAEAEAARVRASAETEVAALRAQARHEADQLLHRARQPTDQNTPPTRGGADLEDPARVTGPGGPQRRQGVMRRPALRPLAAATAVSGLALAAILAGDSLMGTSGTCPPARAGPAVSSCPGPASRATGPYSRRRSLSRRTSSS